MKRRGFLRLAGTGLLAGAAGGLSGTALIAAPRRKPTLVVLTDISPETPLPRMAAVLGPMLDQGLPVTCIVRPRGRDGRLMSPESELALLLRSYMDNAPGILEIMAHADGLAGQTDYFQARTAYQARQELIEALIPPDAARLPEPLMQSLACDPQADPASPLGVRSAGIRNVLVLPRESASVTSEYWDSGVLRLTGGVRADLFAAVEQLGKLAPQQFQNVILLSVADNARKSEHVVKAAATVFANVALQHEADQWISTLRLSDMQLRDGYFRFERRIGLHLIEPPSGDTGLMDGHLRFREELDRARIPFSVGAAQSAGGGLGLWIPTEDGTTAGALAHGAALGCARDGGLPPLENGAYLPAGVGTFLDMRAGGSQGLDACGRVHVPTLRIGAPDRGQPKFLTGTAHTHDLVLSVDPEATATQARRTALRQEIAGLTQDWVTRLVPVADVVRPILPQGPLISLYRHTEAYVPRIARSPLALTEEEQQSLYEDAVTAWSYFYRFTDKRTGLCPATVYYASGTKIALDSATMWDIGSHINGLVAAVDLGLIEKGEFQSGIARLLANIAGREVEDRLLPHEWIRTNRAGRGNNNFDGSDAGRLLAALHNLRKHRYADVKTIERVVGSWTFDKVIENGQVMSLKDGKRVTSYVSHSAHYAALAFRKWGYSVASPYETAYDAAATDGRMALLEAVAEIGPFGAEPLLLEALDFGLSTPSDYLSQVLFGAQLREYDITGDLICVSEGPIDRSPWFTYQGLQVDAPDRTWVVDLAQDNPDQSSAKFQRENRVVSSKAAFLWAAERPHAFSRALVDYVRKRGRTGIGFASSIYSNTDSATQNYSDINTNGIILQAVAKILGAGGHSG